jgi:retron-type reverse transcriptase
MIFLDKPGKKDKSHKRAYRPITLSSFIIKIFERLFLWDLEQEHFQEKPIHEKQHGYRIGRGCDSALAETLDCIESGYHRQEYVLVLWFDIK